MGNRWTVSGVIILLVAIATGCSRVVLEPMPDIKGRVAIRISKELPDGSDLGAGVQRIPNTSVYVSTAEKKTAHVGALSLDMFSAAQRVLADELARADRNRFVTAGPADATLEIVPYLVVATTGSDRIRPWVFLKTSLKDAAGTVKWKTRYMVSLGEPRPLEGPNGWAAGDGVWLRTMIDHGLRTATWLLMRDASGTLPRNTGRDVKVKAQWPWSKEPVEYTAEVLDETRENIILVAKLIDGPAAGVTVFEKRSVQLTVK